MDEPDGTKARPGSLETSSTALPCDLEQKKWTWVRDGIGWQGMQAGMRGKVFAKFGARLCSSPWPPSRSRHQLLDQHVLMLICGRAEGGRWELAAATGRLSLGTTVRQQGTTDVRQMYDSSDSSPTALQQCFACFLWPLFLQQHSVCAPLEPRWTMLSPCRG